MKEWAQKETLLSLCALPSPSTTVAVLSMPCPNSAWPNVLKASLKLNAGLSNYYPFTWSPKNILKEQHHKSSTGEEEEGTACFGWALQIDKFSILLLLPLPSPLYFRQFLNMVFISPTNSSLVQYWPPFSFFSMLEISMGAWNKTKLPFSYRKHSGTYRIRAQRGQQRMLSRKAVIHLWLPWLVRLEGTARIMEINCESNNSPSNFKTLPKNFIPVNKGLCHFPYLNDLVVVGCIRFINGLQEGPRVLVSLHHI